MIVNYDGIGLLGFRPTSIEQAARNLMNINGGVSRLRPWRQLEVRVFVPLLGHICNDVWEIRCDTFEAW